jgi:MoxR-like ATPase
VRRKFPTAKVNLVGRDDTVRALSAQLMTRRFVSIVGPGGMGKTTVAVSIARPHRFLSLAPSPAAPK